MASMFIYVNAAGCPNACRHCGADGHPPYGGFYSVDELRSIADEWGPIVPYFEFTVHPQFPEILDPRIVGEGWKLIPTNGFGLAEREDYKAVFERLRELGINEFSFTLHGLEDKHDWFVCRKGAFQTILKAGRRAAEEGFNVFWQVFLDQQNLDDIPHLIELGKREFGISCWLEVPRHSVSRRLWRYENIRPQLRDVKKLLDGLHTQDWLGPLKEKQLEELTESAWFRAWQQESHSEEFGPRTWPQTAPFHHVINIDNDRQVFLSHWCGESIHLGSLSDGKDEIMMCLEQVSAPAHYDLSPAQAKLPPGGSELLHPNGFSVRCKAVSYMLYGDNVENL
ncbi:radical SAM protein [bacterium]|nr:radical SAM protein [bacterium]